MDNKEGGGGMVQGFAVAMGGTVIGGGIVAAILQPHYTKAILICVLIAIVLVALAILAIRWVSASRRKRKAKGLEGDVGGVFDKPEADPQVKARLLETKRKFLLLIERLKKEGHTNIYDMPWFLTLGPSGTGKSWVLKSSGLEPLEEVDWQQGTFLIDWWSCSDALVLDTAGGVVFREDKSYDSPEWKALLGLLKKHRPQCPITGVLVIVPAQLLWLKPEELPDNWLTLEEYASALRNQLRKRLQDALQVRFPVHVVVTQTDRVPGFREFANALEHTGRQKDRDQIIGWTNPVNVGSRRANGSQKDAELEEIEAVGPGLSQVANELRQKRLALLTPFAGRSAAIEGDGMLVRQRAAELFTFPDAIDKMAPRMQEFLKAVFRTDKTLPKRPYLRGVYFTSALRVGEVLDRQRAGQGKALAHLALPGRTDGAEPNPFFLRDAIFEKSFTERGLVTPLVEASNYLRGRKRALMFTGVGAALLLLGAIFVGGTSFYRTIGRELQRWEDVRQASTNTANRYWLPVAEPAGNSLAWNALNLQKQADLAKSASAGLSSSGFWSFRWLFGKGALDQPRREAQLKLFERGVILPFLDFTKANLIKESDNQPGTSQEKIRRFSADLAAVLEVELATNRSWPEMELRNSRDRVFDAFFSDLSTASGETNNQNWTKIKAAFDQTYSGREGEWPPKSLRQPGALTNLVAIAFGRLDTFISQQVNDYKQSRTEIEDLLKQVDGVKQTEARLIDTIGQNSEPGKDLSDLQQAWKSVLANTNLDSTSAQTLNGCFARFKANVENDTKNKQNELRAQFSRVNGVMEGTNLTPLLLLYGFKKLHDPSDIVKEIADFTPYQEKAAVLDALILTNGTGAPASPADKIPPRLLARRIEVYQNLSNLQPNVRREARDLFDDQGSRSSDPKDILDAVLKSAVSEASQVCNAQAGSFPAGLANDTGPYSVVVSNYVIVNHLRGLLKESQQQTKAILDIEQYKLSGVRFSARPSIVMSDVDEIMAKLAKVEAAWNELGLRCRDLADQGMKGSIEFAKTRLIGERRSELFDGVSAKITADKLEGFPVTKIEATKGEAINSDKVLAAWKNTTVWRDCAQTNKVNKIPKDWLQKWEDIANQRLQMLSDLVNSNGDILEYEISNPWTTETTVFKSLLKEADLDQARTAAGAYRNWKIGGKKFDVSDTQQSGVSVRADDGFELEAQDKDSAPATIVNGLPSQWTVMGLIRAAGAKTKSPWHFVPVQLRKQSGADLQTVWLAIKPVTGPSK